MRAKQSGFTIIELIVVIALLGILSAVALPRFINVTDDAHNAAVEGAGAGFATGIALLKAQVVANGDLGGTNVDDVDGYGEDPTLDVNTNGYPVGTDDGNDLAPNDDADCAAIWGAMFQSNGPTVAASGSSSSVDYVASFATPDCDYTYQQGSGTREISYTASTGAVSVTTP
ncbi:MAG: type II secretion system GspH family protein [Motiliproteus sp.]|nr:type II secretion system GspH family protein [Motiliproteus sp.]MCW9050888.1 type II secretion system GspH family protein [Motiliproteus sp.]